MTNKHCYLFALEVKPMQVGQVYDELPLHCTLMHRFWIDLGPEEFSSKIGEIFKQTPKLTLNAHERLLLGPKQMAVSELELTDNLKSLHMQLYEALNSMSTEYTAPDWVGEGYRAHVTERGNEVLEVGTCHVSEGIYLIEVNVPGYDHQRIVRTKFSLGD